MRKTLVVLPLAFIVTFFTAQTVRKPARAASVSAHLPSPAIVALEKIEP